MFLVSMCIKKLIVISVLIGVFLYSFDGNASQQPPQEKKEDASATAQSSLAEDDKGVTKLPPLDDDQKVSSSELTKNEVAPAAPAENTPAVAAEESPKQPAAAENPPAAATEESPKQTSTAENPPAAATEESPKQPPAAAENPPAAATEESPKQPPAAAESPPAAATEESPKQPPAAAESPPAAAAEESPKQPPAAAENPAAVVAPKQESAVDTRSVLRQSTEHNTKTPTRKHMNISKNRPGQLPKTGRKETVAPQNNNPQSTPTVVNSNGHVEKVGKLSDLELDRWYFFASPETVKRIVEAQKTGNLPPELAKSSTEKNTEPQATQEPAPAEKSAEEKTDSKNILADITIDTNGNKVNAVDDKGNKMSFPPTATENNMVLMNGDKSIAVITEDGTHIKTVPNNWEPGALLNNATKPVERPAESAQAPATEPAQAPTTESAQAPATEPAQAPTTEPAQAPATEPSPSKEEPKTEGPAIQILDKPLDLAQGVPEGFIPKNAVGVILAG